MAELPPPAVSTTAEHRLELTQLSLDLKSVFGSHWFAAAVLDLIAEKLYDLGVRSRLHAAVVSADRIHFTSDPVTGLFDLTEPGSYELIMERPDLPDISSFNPSAPVMRPVLYRLVKRGDLVLKDCPRCRSEHPCRYHAAPGPRIAQMSEVPGHEQAVVGDRPLPEGVLRVMQFVQLLDFGAAGAGNRNWAVHIADGQGGGRTIDRADLKAVLAEIPDVAPRYPTIWAYEQACCTIRERDARIEKALELLSSIEGDMDGEDLQQAVHDVEMALRLRMPRTVPATEEDKSEVTRALEFVDQLQVDDIVVPQTIVGVLAAAYRELLENPAVAVGPQPVSRCPRCEHLVEQHAEDGTGCQFTVSDVHMGLSANCPCTFNARNEQKVIDGE